MVALMVVIYLPWQNPQIITLNLNKQKIPQMVL